MAASQFWKERQTIEQEPPACDHEPSASAPAPPGSAVNPFAVEISSCSQEVEQMKETRTGEITDEPRSIERDEDTGVQNERERALSQQLLGETTTLRASEDRKIQETIPDNRILEQSGKEAEVLTAPSDRVANFFLQKINDEKGENLWCFVTSFLDLFADCRDSCN